MKQTKKDGILEESEKNVASEEPDEFTKARIIKNLVIVSFTFLISFTASEGLGFLQSTMNKEVGVISYAVQYACGCIAALFLPKYLIKKYGSKLVLVVSMFAYLPYLSSNFYPVFGFMIPTSILVGFASSLVFNSVCTYLNDLSYLYTKLSSRNECQNHNKNSSPPEKRILENPLRDSPQLYQSIRKHKDSIFIIKQSLRGESVAFPNGADKEIALIEFKSASPLNKRYLKEQKPDALNCKFENILKQKFDSFKNKAKELSTTEDILNTSVFDNNAGNQLKFSGTKSSGKIIPESHIPRLSSVPEGIRETETGNESKITVEEKQNDSFAQILPPSDEAIKMLETTTSRFFGFFGFVYQMCHVLCHVVSYSVFQKNSVDRIYTNNSSCICGSQFCSMESACALHNLQVPSTEIRYTLTTVFIVISFASALLTLLFLDHLKQENGDVSFSLEMAVMTLKFHRNKNQLLLVPLSLYIGIAQAFLTGDFTKDFIGCAWGVEHVSLVGMSAGCAISLFSGLYALLEKHVGRRVFFCLAAAINLIVNITMLCWIPDSTKPVMMFVVAALWGAVLGIMWCQVRAFIGLIFKEEEETAFGCYQLWHALGSAIVYAYNNYICTYLKIYIMLIVSTIACVGYLFAERNYDLSKKQCNKT